MRCFANGITALLSSLNSTNLMYEIRAKKARKSERNRKKLDENAVFFYHLVVREAWALHKKHFLPFHVLLNVGVDPNFPQKSFFFPFLASFREKFRFPAKTFLA